MPDDKPIDRRRFFRSGLSELLKPLARAVKPLEAIANELGKLDEPPAPKPRMPEIRPAGNTVARSSDEVEETPQAPADQHWVRPPGALPEQPPPLYGTAGPLRRLPMQFLPRKPHRPR